MFAETTPGKRLATALDAAEAVAVDGFEENSPEGLDPTVEEHHEVFENAY